MGRAIRDLQVVRARHYRFGAAVTSRRACAHSFGMVLLAGIITLSALAGCSSAATVKQLPLLKLPPNLATQLSAYHIYVSDVETGDVAEVGVFTRHVSGSVHGVGLSPDNSMLFVTDIQNHRLDAFDLDGRQSFVTASGPAHSAETGILPVHMVSNGHVIFVSDYGQNSVTVISATTWKPIKTISVCKNPHGIVMSPDGRFVYTSCVGGRAVAVIDVASQTLVTTIQTPVASQPYGIAMSADGRYVYASDNLSGRLLVLDTTTDTYLRSVGIGSQPMLMARSPDGRRLYVSNFGSHTVSVLDIGTDPASPTVLAAVPVAGYPHGLAVTPDGHYVVTANTYGDTLSVIDTSTNIDIGTIHGEQYPNDVVITG